MFRTAQNIRQLTGKLLLVLFVGYFVGVTFFPHKHIVNNQVIVHSHPFSSSEPHSHSSNIINLLFQLSGFATKLFVTGISLVAFFKLSRIVSKTYINTYNFSNFLFVNFLRPPPAVI